LLFHGSFLLNFDLGLVEQVLPMPSKEPDYRRNRSHTDFLVNLEIPAPILKSALVETWKASEPQTYIDSDRIAVLVSEKYATKEWNFKF
jgi:lipoate-protein ligase A